MFFCRLLRFQSRKKELRRKVVTVVVLQSSGIQFHAMLRMAATPVKNKIHITSHSAHWTSPSPKHPKRVRRDDKPSRHAPGKASSRVGCVFFSPSALPRRKVVTVVVLQSSGIQFYVLLRMSITPVKKEIHITSHSSHIHRLRLWKLDGKAYTKQRPTQTKAYTKQRPTQNKSLQKTKAYKRQRPTGWGRMAGMCGMEACASGWSALPDGNAWRGVIPLRRETFRAWQAPPQKQDKTTTATHSVAVVVATERQFQKKAQGVKIPVQLIVNGAC